MDNPIILYPNVVIGTGTYAEQTWYDVPFDGPLSIRVIYARAHDRTGEKSSAAIYCEVDGHPLDYQHVADKGSEHRWYGNTDFENPVHHIRFSAHHDHGPHKTEECRLQEVRLYWEE